MSRIVTLSEIKAAEAARRREAVTALKADLAAYARTHGGRFLLFGSAARGTMRYDSDVDILVDFPPDFLDEAWSYAERACHARDLDPDISPLAWCRGRFRDRVTPDLLVLACASIVGCRSTLESRPRSRTSPALSLSTVFPAFMMIRRRGISSGWRSCTRCSLGTHRWKPP
jgi:hypothetical protein